MRAQCVLLPDRDAVAGLEICCNIWEATWGPDALLCFQLKQTKGNILGRN